MSDLSLTERMSAIRVVEEAGADSLAAELVSLREERDPELFWSGMLRAVERRESREQDGKLLSVLGGWLSEPNLDSGQRELLLKKFEALQGRGSFGARGEFFLSNFHRQAFDAKALAPMLAAGLLGKAVQATVLARVGSAGAKYWAASTGFAAEVAVLGAAHGDFGRSALSLGAMKLGLWAGTKVSAPAALTVLGGAVLSIKAEEALGWRAPGGLGENLVEAGSSALIFGVGHSLANRLLGPRFRELQARLSAGSSRSRFDDGNLIPTSRLAPLGPSLSENGNRFVPKPLLMSAHSPDRGASGGFAPRLESVVRLQRKIPNSQGEARPFELILAPESAVGERTPIALRDNSLLWARVEKRSLNTEGDPITPSGVTRVNMRLEEGDSRGLAFLYYDQKAVTLFFIDLEETMITGGPAMRPGTGSVFASWLAEQAWRQGKSFNVTRITSAQTVKILERMNLIKPDCRVEACNRINPEGLDEEFRVHAEFRFGDRDSWGQHRRETDFFNVYGRPPRVP